MQRQTKYQPFQNLFYTAQQARDHRRRETLFGRMPYLQVDNTIEDVEKNRTLHVEEIFNAMTSGEVARDNNGSIAMKRWVGNAHYPGNLVEAYAHKVFDCLLQQAREGFRGWEHNDYVADERKGDDIDREVDCAGRLANIIQALEQEKTICEDVMNSACQIRMFVNAPRAYANRKHQNRVGNSKRGKEPRTESRVCQLYSFTISATSQTDNVGISPFVHTTCSLRELGTHVIAADSLLSAAVHTAHGERGVLRLPISSSRKLLANYYSWRREAAVDS
ncbi:hypothetical protein SNOG_13904 [Parastagonospora nodorum SN15]|uniref:Uncharacterized protein n=1 Tax=Phaeosphaeria nodorum (strain SN15 / ATCC MYA-4574 / FGSC 10173) TaxID=321614 RepID=Q0U2N0_PHANO|nr:hypothetical protein SNOG_13904 [Parastagonospora nodorum SN15]EAT78529.2 hypothetical protein SNOG_13904 [Parastagonospora nodorum SN15]